MKYKCIVLDKINNSYRAMKARCYDKNNVKYKNYGARGITVCNEWLEDKNKFIEWSFKNGYKIGLTIDRINVNGNYCPENCRWSDIKTQCNNRTNNHLMTFNGETLTLQQWCEKLNMKRTTLQTRINRGWSIERALTTKKMINQYG